YARFRAGRAADGAALRRAGDPRLHLSGAAGRDGGLPPSSPRSDAVLYRRCSHRSGLSLGRGGGETLPFWNQRDEFGDTNLLVVKPEEGRSRARALGSHAAVLMNNHGATVVGRDLRELVSRSIFMCQNAHYQLHAHLLGKLATLTAGETRLAGSLNAM